MDAPRDALDAATGPACMSRALRPYQATLKQNVYDEWTAGAKAVLMRLDTGGGKTEIFCEIIQEHVGASCVMVHRQEIVGSISLTLARRGIRHNIIAARATCQAIAALHVAELGVSFYDPGSRCAVASLDTLVTRKDLASWAAQVTLVVPDEAHHVLLDNKWGKALALFNNPALRLLLPTATPGRPDGKGLGRHADGVADVMVQGPAMRWLIEEGYLCDYRMVCVESDVVALLSDQKPGASGDLSPKQLREASKASHIVGDMASEYVKWARGLTGIAFTSDIETAIDTVAAYRALGVRAELVTGKTPDGLRRQTMRQLEHRQIDVIVVVDIVSEGTDIPAVQMISMGRRTESLILFMQQFGRGLRPLATPEYKAARNREERLAAIAASAKPFVWVIDHVSNFLRHRAPDMPREWTLDRRGSRSSGPTDAIPQRACGNVDGYLADTPAQLERLAARPWPTIVTSPAADGSIWVDMCGQPYERFRLHCPYCAAPAPAPATRSTPAAVEGDLIELDPEALAALRTNVLIAQQTVEQFRESAVARGVPVQGQMQQAKLHAAKLDANAALRAAMTAWTAGRLAEGLRDREVHRLFWLTFGTDVLTAQTLDRAGAEGLTERLTAASASGIGAG